MTTVKNYKYHDWRQLNIRGEQCMKKKSEIDETRNKKINWRHFFIICSVLISAYLINGEHAQTVCNICTTVPAAIFTYEQLSDHTTRIFAYKATLFYWSIHGILIAFDSIFVDAFGYFFGKFILLIVLFFNVVYQHDVAKSLMEQQQRRNAMANSMVSSDIPVHFSGSFYASQIGLNTAMTITDATQFSAESLFRRYPSLHYNNLTTAYSLSRSPEMTAYLDTSYTHDGSLKTVASTTEQFKFGIQKHRQITLNDSSILSDYGEENDGSENDTVKSTPAGDCQKVENEIIFKHPFTEMVTIHVKNKHSRPIMWALKTNAIKRMIAQPTCGTLGKDATVHIKIGVTAIPPEESNMNDRAAIDYCLIDDDTTGFDRSFLYNTEDPFRRRKKFNIYYEN
uniref:Major sperm protein n=1 Tax=Brugia malayi TaxID=6279 RepID=A0A1I9G3D2_BRUMA|nr:Bm6335, isoform c [Brugia malayi]